MNTGELPGSTAAYVPGVFIAVTKLDTHLQYAKNPGCPLGLFYSHLSRNTSVHLLLHSQLVLDP